MIQILKYRGRYYNISPTYYAHHYKQDMKIDFFYDAWCRGLHGSTSYHASHQMVLIGVDNSYDPFEENFIFNEKENHWIPKKGTKLSIKKKG